MPKKVGLDVDGVIWDLPRLILNKIEEDYGVKHTLMEIESWHFIQKYPTVYDMFANFEEYKEGGLIPGAEDFVRRLETLIGTENVFFITHSYPEIIEEKTKMFLDILGIEPERIIHAEKKWLFTADAFLVDDYHLNILGHVQNNNMPGLLMDMGYGWAQDPIEHEHELVQRINGYDEALDIITNHFSPRQVYIPSVLNDSNEEYTQEFAASLKL